MKLHRILPVVAILAITCAQVQAAPTYFTADAVLPGGIGTLQAERTLFQGAAAGQGVTLLTEGFEAFASGNPVNFPDFSLTHSGGGSGFSQISGNNLITTEGNSVISFTIDGATSTDFNFSSPINAFGIDITSIDQDITTVSFLDDLGNVLNSFNNFAGFAGATFFGVVNDQAFNTVRFAFSGSEIINFDFLQYGASTSVPEPSAILLLAFGLIGLGFVRRQRS